LGTWTTAAVESQQWHAHYNPATKEIHTNIPGQQPLKFTPTSTTRSHIYYQQPSIQSSQQNKNFPITIETQKNGTRITKPLYSIPNPSNPAPVIVSQAILTQIRQKLPTYAPELWSQLIPNPTIAHRTLAEHIGQNRGKIIVVSDASLNAQHWSAFSWIIATNNTELWTGAGTSRSTQRDAYSGQSEGYRILAALTFLEKYIIASNLILPIKPRMIVGYCDNSGLIQQVTTLQTETIPNPSQTISNDYDLSNEIYQTIRRIPIPIVL